MPTLTQLLKSKTLIFSVALAVLSASQGLVLQLALTPLQQSIVGMVVAGAIAALRVITTTPLAEK